MGSFNDDPEVVVRKKFGLFAFLTNDVKFESGTSYSIPGVLARDESLREFKGKRLVTKDEPPSSTHVVVIAKMLNKDGEIYQAVKDMTTGGKDLAWKVLQPSLKRIFGKDYGAVLKPSTKLQGATWIAAAIEEVPTGEKFTSQQGDNAGNEIAKSAWKVVEWFEDEKTMRAAEKAHFARFTQNPSGASNNDLWNEAVEQARALHSALKKSCKPESLDATFLTVAAADGALNKYDAAKLLEAVKA